MQIGTEIKLERIKRKMKQETLAKGICSPAHLSRIENGLSVPSEEMIHMLSKRLGISLFGNKLAHENMNNTLEKVVNQSIHVINRRDKKQAIRLVEEAEEMLKMQEMNAERRIDIELLILRLLIMEKSNSEIVLREVNKYKEVEATLNTIQRFRVYVIIGITNYVRGGLIQSLKAFTIASELSKVPIISQFEQADFLYTYAVVLMADTQKIKALERTKLAMEYFKSEMVNRRFVECLLLCGIAYKQMNQFEKALETFLQAERVFDKQPPKYIYYNSGGFQGYIGLINYSKIGTLFFADYKGTVYDAPPYPIPASIYLED